MKKGKYLVLSALVAMSFTACDSDVTVDENFGQEIRLNMIYPGQATRALDESFEADDLIGVYVTKSESGLQLGGNEVNNQAFRYSGSSWTAVRSVYWNSGTHDVYAYYPYSEAINDIENYSFKVEQDQSTHTAYTKSDFMWASKTKVEGTSSAIDMQFAHKMSSVIVQLNKGESYTGNIPDNAEVYIYSTVTDAVIDLSTGDVTKDSYAGENTIKCLKLDDGKYTAIVVPQSITSRCPLVEVVVDNVSYLMEGKISFRQGYRHTVTVTLEQDPEKIKIEVGGKPTTWG